MSLIRDDERAATEALADTNPFGPERVDKERTALGDAFVASTGVWHVDATLDGLNSNTPELI